MSSQSCAAGITNGTLGGSDTAWKGKCIKLCLLTACSDEMFGIVNLSLMTVISQTCEGPEYTQNTS